MTFRHLLFAGIAASASLLCPAWLRADAVVTSKDVTIEGDIVFEDDNEIRLATEKYGDLRFFKMNLKEIIRGSGATAVSEPAMQPAQSDPFSGGNPFALPTGEEEAAAAPEDNPWGAAASGAATDNPFALQASANSSPFAAREGMDAPTFSAPEVIVPEVPLGADGVVFGVVGEPIDVRLDPNDPFSRLTDPQKNLYINSEVQTKESRARIVLRGNRDTVRVPERSQVILREIGQDNVTLELVKGAVWCDVDDRGGQGHFRVVTPVVTAGVVGTTFRVANEGAVGYTIAVVEGSVNVNSLKTQASVLVPANNQVTVTLDGAINPIEPLSQVIEREWAAWDAWGQEAQASLGGAGMGVGAPVINSLIQQNVQQQQQFASIVAEANYTKSINDVGEFVDQVADAFEQYAADTGHVPTDQQGFSVLRQNTANVSGWNGPYWDGAIPPRDAWDRPLRYRVRIGAKGNIVGDVYSLGEDAHDSQGRHPGDIPGTAMFYRQPAVQANPEYAPERLLQQRGADGAARH